MKNNFTKEDIINSFNELINNYENRVKNIVLADSNYFNGTGIRSPINETIVEFNSRCEANTERVFGKNHRFFKMLKEKQEKVHEYRNFDLAVYYYAIIKTIKYEIENNELDSYSELLNANLFSDFLMMAEHLLDENYKDASAVMIGSVLEEHIRKLCLKNGIDLEIPDSKGILRIKKATVLNADLAATGVYEKLDQSNVDSWQKLRNHAAHGDYAKYTKEQIVIFLQSVRDFIARYPA
jgi:hypothetical protein